MTTDKNLSEVIDDIRARSRQEDTSPPVSPEEQAKARSDAESKALERLESRPEREAEAKRYAKIRRSLVNGAGQLRHQHPYTAAEKAALVDSIVSTLGGDVPTEARARIVKLVETATQHSRIGDVGSAMRAAEDAAGDVAGIEFDIEPAKVEDDDNDPASLAARVPR